MNKRKDSQCTKVYEYMKNHGAITAKDAIDELGCLRLAARIADLRKRGVLIERDMVDALTRDGDTTKVAKYFLVG